MGRIIRQDREGAAKEAEGKRRSGPTSQKPMSRPRLYTLTTDEQLLWNQHYEFYLWDESLGKMEYYYELIGEAYVDGMMDGEAIEFQNNKHILPKVFEIR